VYTFIVTYFNHFTSTFGLDNSTVKVASVFSGISVTSGSLVMNSTTGSANIQHNFYISSTSVSNLLVICIGYWLIEIRFSKHNAVYINIQLLCHFELKCHDMICLHSHLQKPLIFLNPVYVTIYPYSVNILLLLCYDILSQVIRQVISINHLVYKVCKETSMGFLM
jgi:hypothetical protein